MQRGFQELDQYGQNKTVYYNDQGHMLYGQQRIANKWYNFDTFDGAMKTGFQYIAGQNKWVYYAVDGNNRGQMQYGFKILREKHIILIHLMEHKVRINNKTSMEIGIYLTKLV